jgi:hypothetical protein
MLSVAKHLNAQGERPFAAAQGDTEGKHKHGSTVKLELSSSFEPWLMFIIESLLHWTLLRSSLLSPGKNPARTRGLLKSLDIASHL